MTRRRWLLWGALGALVGIVTGYLVDGHRMQNTFSDWALGAFAQFRYWDGYETLDLSLFIWAAAGFGIAALLAALIRAKG